MGDHGVWLRASSAAGVAGGVSVVSGGSESSSGVLGVVVAVIGPSTVAAVSGALVDAVQVFLGSLNKLQLVFHELVIQAYDNNFVKGQVLQKVI